MKFVDEFKDFISRGNVVDMAVGVVVGGAFKSIVDSLVADIIDPGIAYVVSLITGALKTAATSTVGDTSAVESVMDMSKWIIPGTSINIGNFLSAIINFPVSYTHLTLPTNREVLISCVDVSFNNNSTTYL